MVKISIYPDMRFVIYLNLFNVFLDVCFFNHKRGKINIICKVYCENVQIKMDNIF